MFRERELRRTQRSYRTGTDVVRDIAIGEWRNHGTISPMEGVASVDRIP